MHERGRTRMLLVLLLGSKRLKHPEPRYWTACFRDQDGRQRRISTKVFAKTVNQDLKALKMLFKNCRKDSAITKDLKEFACAGQPRHFRKKPAFPRRWPKL